ncbi:fumarate hydratase [Candidatus Saganbacteria bacterium CG08_land_8_20_14_0_20_45_16]|uniref:Fumarate hydratase n=1 Tax=Candidatus Saganbacteria bacterium CG08_land_8_20_14_0_20_45_16 TaxID=2014293 RepID=A0A2H0XUC7_UNCSA|nr:MAG: fumarate hydratase [Candidatus Saganbacteria bacterium CG08_land_8_20_14_0_20_45_16]
MHIELKAPLSDNDIKKLKVGDKVLIAGKILVARDLAHQKMVKKSPLDLNGSIIYYASPTPTPPHYTIGSIGPTTATRMDAFTPALIRKGIKITIGKGKRDPKVMAGSVYLVVPGGAAALLSKSVVNSKVLAYAELGSEALREIEVVGFPAIVAIDLKGRSIFK